MEFWWDHQRRKWPVTTSKGPIKWAIKKNAILRAFVMMRDGFTCRKCGLKPDEIPANYDGRELVFAWKTVKAIPPFRKLSYLVVDHVVARLEGGSNHPDNLQVLCEGCNSAKGRKTIRYKNRNVKSTHCA